MEDSRWTRRNEPNKKTIEHISNGKNLKKSRKKNSRQHEIEKVKKINLSLETCSTKAYDTSWWVNLHAQARENERWKSHGCNEVAKARSNEKYMVQ